MKRYIMTGACAMMAVMSAFAQDAVNHTFLNLNLRSGEKVQYKFVQQPVMTLEGQDVKLTYNDETGQPVAVTYGMAEVEKVTFENDPSGVKDLQSETGVLRVKVTSEMIVVDGMAAHASLRVCDMSGAVMASGRADGAGHVELPVASLPAGVYVAVTPTYSFKFIK